VTFINPEPLSRESVPVKSWSAPDHEEQKNGILNVPRDEFQTPEADGVDLSALAIRDVLSDEVLWDGGLEKHVEPVQGQAKTSKGKSALEISKKIEF